MNKTEESARAGVESALPLEFGYESLAYGWAGDYAWRIAAVPLQPSGKLYAVTFVSCQDEDKEVAKFVFSRPCLDYSRFFSTEEQARQHIGRVSEIVRRPKRGVLS